MDPEDKADLEPNSGVFVVPEKVPEILTVDEGAHFLRVPKSTLYKLLQEGKVPARKVGRHWRMSRRTLLAWISNREEEA